MDPIATVADAAAFGAFFGAAAAFVADRHDQMAPWLLNGTVLGGFGGISRVIAGVGM